LIIYYLIYQFAIHEGNSNKSKDKENSIKNLDSEERGVYFNNDIKNLNLSKSEDKEMSFISFNDINDNFNFTNHEKEKKVGFSNE